MSAQKSEKVTASAASPQHYVCVHGHFYQPPRENPWLETVEVQESAAPFHDWNERITSECYAPNGASRIQNKQNQIVRILNNYARISFNFGPTLLSWLQEFAPRTYRMILDADHASAERFSGHGSAIAQVYNHIIMPLASERDARTQIRWGIADFEHRFGRKPEGMWLAETAVSRKVLDLLAQEGIKYTILAPHQCARVRKLSEPETAAVTRVRSKAAKEAEAAKLAAIQTAAEDANVPWTETPNASVDPTHPYLVQLDEGRSISVFFYDGPGSRAIAFEGVLNNGEDFGRRLVAGLHADKPADTPQLSHVATDGESYGHHHRHGEMALSYALHWIEENNLAHVTNYGEFLEKFPPQCEAEVGEDTSWSCAHGVERWRSNCGCNGGKVGWQQNWRAPLREALDLLRDRTAPLAETLAASLVKDLWVARDAYINVVLDRGEDSVQRFLDEHATHALSPEERVLLFELLELERHTQLMYTSCGWFFDEISGIETVQIIAYAGRVLQLAEQLFGEPGKILEAEFLAVLATAPSNLPEIGNGAEVYKRYVIGSRLDLEHVGAHYAISSMFRSYPDSGQIFCFDVHRHNYDILSSGHGRFAFGRALLQSRITEESEEICFAVLHLGDQNLTAAVRRFDASNADTIATWTAFVEAARDCVRRANLPELIRLIDKHFDGILYSLNSLFADEQQRILQSILNQTLSEVENSLMRIYEEHATLLDFISQAHVPAPPALAVTAGFAINASLRHALDAEVFDATEISRLLHRAETDNVKLDSTLLSFTADKRIKRAMVRLEMAAQQQPSQQSLNVVNETLTIAEGLRLLPMDVSLWQAQNIWNDLLRRSDSALWSREWRDGFRKIGLALNICVDELVVDKAVRAF
jgi:alpha-amylase/alpha-mannosidase (GH57 family)